MKDYYIKKPNQNGGVSFQKICLGEAISSGGEGAVYKIAGRDYWEESYGNTTVRKRVCAKLYSQSHLLKHGSEIEAKLGFMTTLQNKPKFLHDGPNELIQICYPFALLYDRPNGSFVGMLMYYALDGSAKMNSVTVDRAEAYYVRQHQLGILDDKGWKIFQKFKFKPNFEPVYTRFALVNNVANIVHYLHDTGKYVIVDMKPDNFQINERGGVSLVDVDSIQVSSGLEFYPSLVVTPDYIPPEFQKNPSARKTVSYDLFSMAVIFYQILTGIHPYCYSMKRGSTNSGTSIQEHIKSGWFACGKKRGNFVLSNQHKRFDKLPKSIQQLFLRAFEGAPDKRPSSLEWIEELKKLQPSFRKNSSMQKNKVLSQGRNPSAIKYKWQVCPNCGNTFYKVDSGFCSVCGKKRK